MKAPVGRRWKTRCGPGSPAPLTRRPPVRRPLHSGPAAAARGTPTGPVRMLVDAHRPPHVVPAVRPRRDLQAQVLVPDAVVLPTLRSPFRHRMSSRSVSSGATKPPPDSAAHRDAQVLQRPEHLLQVLVGRLHVANALRRQFLRQPTLHGPELALRTPPRLRRIRRDHLDAQLPHRPPELRRVRLVHPAASLRRVPVVAALIEETWLILTIPIPPPTQFDRAPVSRRPP